MDQTEHIVSPELDDHLSVLSPSFRPLEIPLLHAAAETIDARPPRWVSVGFSNYSRRQEAEGFDPSGKQTHRSNSGLSNNVSASLDKQPSPISFKNRYCLDELKADPGNPLHDPWTLNSFGTLNSSCDPWNIPVPCDEDDLLPDDLLEDMLVSPTRALANDSVPQAFARPCSKICPSLDSQRTKQTEDEVLLCLRCKRKVCDSSAPMFAEIAYRSIYCPRDCAHGPFCQECSVRLDNATLALCPGCGALINNINFVKESGPIEAVDTAPRTNGHSESVQSLVLNDSREPIANHSRCTSIIPGSFVSINYTVFVPGNHSHGLSTAVLSAAHVHEEESFLNEDYLSLHLHDSVDRCECCHQTIPPCDACSFLSDTSDITLAVSLL